MQDRARLLDALHAITVAVADKSNPVALTKLMVGLARELTDADVAAFYVRDFENGSLRLVASDGDDQALELLATQVAAAHEAAMARERAERQEERLSTIVEHIPCGVVVFDADGHVSTINEAGRRLKLSEARADDGPVARALKGETVIDCEMRTTDEAWVRLSAVPLCEPDDQVSGAIAVFEDVTGKRHLMERERAAKAVVGRLTAREREVLGLVVKGLTNPQIGQTLGLRPGTVKNHVEHILDKLGVADRTQAAVYASALGLADRTES